MKNRYQINYLLKSIILNFLLEYVVLLMKYVILNFLLEYMDMGPGPRPSPQVPAKQLLDLGPWSRAHTHYG